MIKYTKGEWRVNPHNKQIIETEKTWIATLRDIRGELVANTHLIAKSPRMYELLSKISTQGYWLYQADIKAVKDILNDTPEIGDKTLDEAKAIVAEAEVELNFKGRKK